MGKAYQSCVAMYLALAVGLAFGGLADHYATVSGVSFVIAAGVSVALLVAASFRRRKEGEARTRQCRSRVGGASLAGFASLLVGADAFSGVNRDTLLPQVLMSLPFLLAIGYAVRGGARLAAFGAAGFFATAVAMLYCNCGGGWVGFFYVYCV